MLISSVTGLASDHLNRIEPFSKASDALQAFLRAKCHIFLMPMYYTVAELIK